MNIPRKEFQRFDLCSLIKSVNLAKSSFFPPLEFYFLSRPSITRKTIYCDYQEDCLYFMKLSEH